MHVQPKLGAGDVGISFRAVDIEQFDDLQPGSSAHRGNYVHAERCAKTQNVYVQKLRFDEPT